MEHSELLRHVVSVLEHLGVPYFVTGSVATAYFGEPRFTNDIDVVADLPLDRAGEFCGAFPAGEYYVSLPAVREAIVRRDQFNVIHPSSGLKIDVILPKDTPFDRSRLSRRLRVQPKAGYEAWFGSPEDVIVKKMDFYREGGSEKHLRDIAGVLKIMGNRIDRQYISDWSTRLGLGAIWEAILGRIGS